MQMKYAVFNETDGIFVTHEPVSYEQAKEIVREFPNRFKQQGYYLTATQERIPADQVLLTIMMVEDYEIGNNESVDRFKEEPDDN